MCAAAHAAESFVWAAYLIELTRTEAMSEFWRFLVLPGRSNVTRGAHSGDLARGLDLARTVRRQCNRLIVQQDMFTYYSATFTKLRHVQHPEAHGPQN